MRSITIGALIIGLLSVANAESNADDNWSWNSGPGRQEDKDESKQADQPSGSESVDDVVDSILKSNRQGRNLDGFDEIYTDPNVQDALKTGNDTTARHFIKERLCNLGLMAVSFFFIS